MRPAIRTGRRLRRFFTIGLAFAACDAAAPYGTARVAAQMAGDTIVSAANAGYAPGGRLARSVFGTGWRGLWATPIRVPVLDLAGFAGGLTPERQGGGRQSLTLHMVDASGQGWIFRSIDKFPEQALSSELDNTVVQDLIKDQVSILNPGSHFLMPALLDAVGVLHATPMLYVMPDDPALGEHRELFAGMLGEIEVQAQEGEDDTPGFAGSRKVKSSANFLDDLEDDAEHRLDEREFLRARLIDFLVGDPDRGTDQWRWARFGEEGAYLWRPVPRDRDWALVRADGMLARGAANIYPKLTKFEADLSGIETMTYSSHILDRRLLVRLTREDFEAEAARVVAAITDEVIESAVAAMPPEYVAARGAMIAASLRSRRDEIPDVTSDFYDWLATEVDIHATDNSDVATLERRPDGTVRVSIRSGDLPFYERLFVPAETREVRVFLHGGADTARVTGVSDGPIRLRVLGGGGDDTLIDEAGSARFYDDRGDNRVFRAEGTAFSEVPWRPPLAPEGLRVGEAWSPDWGSSRSVGPTADYQEVQGLIVGARGSLIRYGFRRLPHRWRLDGKLLAATATGSVGAELDLDFRPENSRQRVVMHAAATRIDAFRFHGMGNDSPLRGTDETLYRRDVIRVEPAIEWKLGPLPGRPIEESNSDSGGPDQDDEAGAERNDEAGDVFFDGTVRLGPVMSRTRTRAPDGRADGGLATDEWITQIGGRLGFELIRTDRARMPRRGFGVAAEAAGFPSVRGADGVETFGRLNIQAVGYLPVAGPAGPYIAARAGATRVFGDFPIREAAFVGGRHSLRGYSRGRFAGDAAVHGTLELRVPVDTVKHLIRSELGVFGFGDVGRVWFDGASPGGWHNGVGGGVWLASFGRALSFAIAHGERTRAHLWLGLPF